MINNLEDNRLNHVLRVVSNTEEILSLLCIDSSSRFYKKVITAAYLHDIGYLKELNISDFHAYDGYVYLKNRGYDYSILKIVLHHTHSELLMEMIAYSNKDLVNIYRDISFKSLTEEELDMFDIITLADLMSDSKGNKVSISERVHDIGFRYGTDSLVFSHIEKVWSLISNTDTFKRYHESE